MLTVSQQAALAQVECALARSPVVGLVGQAGTGKSMIAAMLAAKSPSARRLRAQDYINVADGVLAANWDFAVIECCREALENCDLLILDDYMEMRAAGTVVGRRIWSLPMNSGFQKLCRVAEQQGKKILLVGREQPLHQEDAGKGISARWFEKDRNVVVELVPGGFCVEDYRQLASAYLEGKIDDIDFEAVHYHVPGLDARQLRTACRLFTMLSRDSGDTATDHLLDIVEDYVLVDREKRREIEDLSFDRLPGSEAIALALETNVVMPFENPGRARELGVKPKRGVLLYGPPGTGKTSIGRALAHRLRGKFFLIDGAISTEPPANFMWRVNSIVEQAKANAPSVLFIDDADSLFTTHHVAGLERYLLSILDGLESESTSKVCVMMTVMDPAKLPDAILRSGRVELWLETRPPNQAERVRMLQRWLDPRLPEIGDLLSDAENQDISALTALADKTENFTPADLRRIVGDAKLFYADDLAAGSELQVGSAYLHRAIDEVVSMRARMAHVVGDHTLQVGHEHREVLA